MYQPFSGSERRRHDAFLKSASEIRIQKNAGSPLYRVLHADQPMRWMDLDQPELERLKGRAMKSGIPITTSLASAGDRKGEFVETTRVAGRLDSRSTLRPSHQRVVERSGQRRLLSASYHWDGRHVSPAVVSGGAAAFAKLGVLGSQALREHDEDSGILNLPLDENPLFSRLTYSGADEVHVEDLPVNNRFRGAGQPYRVSVSASGGPKVTVGLATEAQVADLRGRLDETMVVIHQDGLRSTQKGWEVARPASAA